MKPPRITTGSAFSAISDSENCTPSFEPQTMPATSATKPATVHTMTQMRFSGMPIDCAAWWSSATARNARPVGVFWKKIARASTSSAATAAATKSSVLIRMPPSKMLSSTITGVFGRPVSIL